MFKKLFGNTQSKEANGESTSWEPLESTEELERIKANSRNRPQLIFKHSTSCGISRMVWNRARQALVGMDAKADLYYLDLLANRQVSNAVSETFSVTHQSPQVLVIKDGEVISHASHGAISEMDFPEILS